MELILAILYKQLEASIIEAIIIYILNKVKLLLCSSISNN